MVLAELQCTRCGHRFEKEVLEDDEVQDANPYGPRMRCPECRSTYLKKLRNIKYVPRHPK